MDTKTHKHYGHLADLFGYHLPLKVMSSAGGYYLGTCHATEGPVSRESEYFATYDEAAIALRNETWKQRSHP